jgi:hypothetical protein
MKINRGTVLTVLFWSIVSVITALSVGALYYRYVVVQDFEILVTTSETPAP